MTAVFSTMGAVLALLVLALLAGGARANDVTGEPCRARFSWIRVRNYPADGAATTLWMDDCGITELNPDHVANLPNIERIRLDINAMTHIDLAVFASAPRLSELYLNDNKLRELLAFSEHSCSSLTILGLCKNLLTTIHPETFSACKQLKVLGLGDNHIIFIYPGTFHKLPDLTNLFLQNNNIPFLRQEIFASNKKLIQLELFNNSLTYLPSDFIINLKQAGVPLTYFRFDSNPWQCACLLEAIADAKRAGVENYKTSPDVKITHYDGTLPECVYSGRYSCVRPWLLTPAPRSPSGGR